MVFSLSHHKRTVGSVGASVVEGTTYTIRNWQEKVKKVGGSGFAHRDSRFRRGLPSKYLSADINTSDMRDTDSPQRVES